MKFELTNKQREYLGLDSIPTTWDKATLKGDTYRPDSIIYFDGNTLRRHIVSTDNEYKETQYNEPTKDKTVLLPKTEKGKEKKLTASVLESRHPIGVYFTADKFGNIFIGSHTTQTTFYSSNWSRKKKEEQTEIGIEQSIETFISESPKNHFDEIRDFKNAKRKNVKYRDGDVFAFRISRTEYGFGRILLDINLLRKKKLIPANHGLFNIMGPPLLVTIYAFTSPTKDIDINSIINNRDRAEYLLNDSKKRGKFTDRLNHQWDKVLDMRFISKIPSGTNDFEFTKKELKIEDNELCYVISNYDDIDGQIIGFAEAFGKVYGRGFGSLIINSTADKLYLETELVQGKQNRFIGKK